LVIEASMRESRSVAEADGGWIVLGPDGTRIAGPFSHIAEALRYGKDDTVGVTVQ
jgi:hypothetical protein